MRIEELNPEKFYAVIVENVDISVEDLRAIETKLKERGLKNVTVLGGDGPSGPVAQRYWGIYNEEEKRWFYKRDGEVYYYPSSGVAQAHLTNYLADVAHVVNGRGHPLTARLVVKEMTAIDDNVGP